MFHWINIPVTRLLLLGASACNFHVNTYIHGLLFLLFEECMPPDPISRYARLHAGIIHLASRSVSWFILISLLLIINVTKEETKCS